MNDQDALQLINDEYDKIRVRLNELDRSVGYKQFLLDKTDNEEINSIMEAKKKGYFEIGN